MYALLFASKSIITGHLKLECLCILGKNGVKNPILRVFYVISTICQFSSASYIWDL